MKINKSMYEKPSLPEVLVFRTFGARLISLQKKVNRKYHTDGFLRDLFLTAVEVPAIQVSLRDHIPRSSNQALNRVANQLSDKINSAGSASAFLTEY